MMLRVVVLGGSGMIGGGVLRECVDDPRVERVVSVGRRPSGLSDPKLEEVVVSDLFDLEAHRDRFVGVNACFYCLGVSSTGLSEAEYRRITRDLTLAILEVVGETNPDLTVCFVSGQGSDSSESGGIMWARVKGEAENDVLARYSSAFVFRPGIVQPLKGTRSRTLLYRVPYALLTPVLPLLQRLFPRHVTTTVAVGQAMIRAAIHGHDRVVLETADINALAGEGLG